MESQSDPKPWYYWQFSKRTTVVVLIGLGLFLLVFQVNKLLSSSFRIEIFGVEILEVQHLEDTAAAEEPVAVEAPVIRKRPVIRPRMPLPPLLPMPPDEPDEREAIMVESEPIVCSTPLLSRPLARQPQRLAPQDLPSAEEAIFVVVEQMPELIGGLRSIQRQIRYPEIAKRAGLEGRVIIQFIVDERGCVASPRIVRGIGGGADEEALRVVSQARFRPGKQRGKNVNVKMALPVTFKLQ